MKSKVFFVGVAVGALIVGSVSLLCTKVSRKEVRAEEGNTKSLLLAEKSQEDIKPEENEPKEILEIVSKKKVYLAEYDSENYEVLLRNTSMKTLAKVEITFGQGIYELYNIGPNETFKVISYNDDENIKLEIIAVNYSIPDFGMEEVTLTSTVTSSKIKCTVKNVSEREIYANQVVYFLRDAQGNVVMKTLEYSGCFNPELVTAPNKEFSFEFEIPEGYTFIKDKGIIFKYSDLDFRDYIIKQFTEVA